MFLKGCRPLDHARQLRISSQRASVTVLDETVIAPPIHRVLDNGGAMPVPRPDAARLEHRYRPQLEICDRLLGELWTHRPRPRDTNRDEYLALLLAILDRTLTTFDGVLALCRAGRPQQALMLDRSLFEDMVAAFWLSAHEPRSEALQLIRDQADHNVLLTNDVIRKYPHRFLIEADNHPDLKNRQAEFKKKFGAYGTQSWFGDLHSALQEIKPLWEELGGEAETLDVHYAAVHWQLNLNVHLTVRGIARAFEHYGQSDTVDDNEMDVALRAGFFSVQGLGHLVYRAFGLPRDRLWEIEQVRHHVFSELKPNDPARADLGPYDPCWCGSGKKLKFCHGK